MPVTKVKSSWQTTVLRSRSNRWELQFWCAPTEQVKPGWFRLLLGTGVVVCSRARPKVTPARLDRSVKWFEGVTVLHDQVDVATVLKHTNVGQWVAVDGQDVGAHSHGDRSCQVIELTASGCD